MSDFQTTDAVIAIFPTRIGNPKQFVVISQDRNGKMSLYKKVGARFRFALMEDDGAGGSFYDPGNITSIQFLISQGNSNYVLDTLAGPFAAIDNTIWRNGIKPAGQHFLFQFSSTDLNLPVGTYTLSITGNTSDPLAPVDFYVECELEILDRADATGNATALSDNEILQAINDQVKAALAQKVDRIGAAGDSITLTAVNPTTGEKARVVIQLTFNADTGPVLAMNPEVLP